MEKRAYIFIFLVSFKYVLLFMVYYFTFVNNVQAQYIKITDRVLIAGYVFEQANLDPIPHVNVYIKQSRRGTITNSSGYFILNARINDTIVFSSVGYEKKYTIITDSLQESTEVFVVLLEEKYYELKSVDILALRRYEQFKYEVINMRLPDDGFVYAIKNFPSRPADIDYHSRAGVSDFGLVFSPITALYDAFSKEGRERRKLMELIERDKRKEIIENKISIQKISRITGLNNYQSEEFFKWCNLPVEFILKLNDYDLILLIIYRFEQYKTTSHYNKHINR